MEKKRYLQIGKILGLDLNTDRFKYDMRRMMHNQGVRMRKIEMHRKELAGMRRVTDRCLEGIINFNLSKLLLILSSSLSFQSPFVISFF